MKSFSVFLKESLILEGGNAPYINRETGEILGDAERMNLKEVNRTKIRKSLLKMFDSLNKLYQKKYNESIWTDMNVINSGHAFNGSSEHFFNSEISDDEFKTHKPTVGDIDVTIPRDKLKPLFELLAELENKNITPDFVYMGQNKKQQQGHQINSIFQLQKPKLNIQVDFEGVTYTEDHKPTEFGKFSHNSAWDDIKQGMKGVGHKFLIQNLARGLSEMKDVVVLTKSSPSEPPEKVKVSTAASSEAPTNLAFSVDRGIREKYVPAVDSQGKQVYVDGKPAFREVDTKKSVYHTDVKTMFTMIFKQEPSKADLQKFHSFVGILSLLKKYKVEDDLIKRAFENLLSKSLFGKGAQGLEKNNPEGDRAIKTKIVEEMIKKFPYLKPIYNGYDDEIKKYYDNYKMVKVEP